MGVMEMTQITNVITLSEYADKHGLDVKRLRRLARKNEWPTTEHVPFKFGGEHGVWAIDANAPAVELPTKSARGARRPDGRQRYIVYVNAVELTVVKNAIGNDNVIDPRVAAKTRRNARETQPPVARENDITLHGVPMTELPDGTLIVKTENDDNE